MSSRSSHLRLANHVETGVTNANVQNHNDVPQKKASFLFKTTKISILRMKEAMTFLLEVAASSAEPMQR